MANNTQIILTPEIKEAFPAEVLDVIRTSLCPTATDPEFLLFAHKAASYRLDPFKNEIFFIKYGSQARIQFAAEAYLAKAREKEGFQPPDTQTVCANDTFKARKFKNDKGEDEWEVIEHEVTFPRGPIVGAYSIAYRDGYRPVTVFVDKEHIAHMYTGQNKDNWNKWEPDMIGKHAEQRALKKQYGLDFGNEELEQPPAATASSFERKDITNEVNQATTAANTQATPQDQPNNSQAEGEEDQIKKLKAEIKQKYQKLGITGKEQVDEHMSKYFKQKGDAPTIAEVKAYIKILDLQIQEKQAALNDELPL